MDKRKLNGQLRQAIKAGNIGEMTALLKSSANVNAPVGGWDTALLWAAENNKVEVARCLIEHGADVNLRDGDEDALSLACYYSRSEMIQYLVTTKANINRKSRTGYTPLIQAASKGCLEGVKALLAANADIDFQNRDGITALMIAFINNHTETAKVIIERKYELGHNLQEDATYKWAKENNRQHIISFFEQAQLDCIAKNIQQENNVITL